MVETAPPEEPANRGPGAGHEEILPSAPARDFVLVHLDSSIPVQLEYRPDEATPFEPLCTSPCVRSLPASGIYRVGPVITDAATPPNERPATARPSGAFVLAEGKPRQTIIVHAAAQSTFGLGLGLTITGGVAVGFGCLWMFVESYEGDGEAIRVLAPALTMGFGGVGLATGIFLLASNLRSKVTVDGEPAQAPPRPEAEHRAVDGPWRLDDRQHERSFRPPMTGAVLPLFHVEF